MRSGGTPPPGRRSSRFDSYDPTSTKGTIIAVPVFLSQSARGFGAALAAMIVLVATWPGQTAAAAEEPAGLTVEISDGATETAEGDERSFEATLVNTGPDAVDAILVLTAPAYAGFAASGDADVSGSDASWSLSVEPGQSRTVSATVEIGEIPESEYQVTTLASVYLGEVAGAPLLRTADVNSIPGVTNPVIPETGKTPSPVAAWIDNGLLLGTVIAVPVVLAGVVIGVVIGRRRRTMLS